MISVRNCLVLGTFNQFVEMCLNVLQKKILLDIALPKVCRNNSFPANL